jgi:hypothetical protein
MLSLCAYHSDSDFEELSNLLINHGFNINHSMGYMIMWMQFPCKAPFLRRGVIYAEKA